MRKILLFVFFLIPYLSWATTPTISSATWRDTDADGNIDQVILGFSIPVEITDTGSGLDCLTITNSTPAETATLEDIDYTIASTSSLTINFTGITTTTIGNFSIAYDQSAANSSIEDAGGPTDEIADGVATIGASSLEVVPTVTTGTVVSITSSGATIPVTVTNAGTGTVADVSGIIHYPFTAADRIIGGTSVVLVDGGAFTLVGTAESIAVGSLSPATRYTYRGVAGNTAGTYTNAGYSARGDFWTLSTEPTTSVASITPTVTSTQIDFSWTDLGGGESGYLVLANTFANSGDLNTDITEVEDGLNVAGQPGAVGSDKSDVSTGTPSSSFTTINSSAVAAETRYYFSVIPYAVGGDAATTNYRLTSAFTQSIWTLSTEPTNHSSTLTATAGDGQVSLAFDAANTLAGTQPDGYLILRKTGATAINGTDVSVFSDGSAPGSPGVLLTTTNNTATSYVDNTAVNGTQYQYALIPFNYNGVNNETYNYKLTGFPTDDATPVASTSPTLTTGTVTNVSVSGAIINYTINTTGSPAAQKSGAIYYIADGNNYVRSDVGTNTTGTPSGNPIQVEEINNNTSTSRTLTGLTTATQYSAIPFASRSNNSNPGFGTRVNFWTLSTEPTASVASITPTVTSTQIDFSWTDPGGGESGYLVLANTFANSGDLNTDITEVEDGLNVAGQPGAVGSDKSDVSTGTPSSSFTTINSSAVAAETRYYFSIIPYAVGGDAATTNYRLTSAFTQSIWTLSTEPTNHSSTLTATAGDGQVSLAFDAANTLAGTQPDGYLILRKTGATAINGTDVSVFSDGSAPGSPGVLLTTTNNTATSYVDNTAVNGTQYQYALIPFNYNGANNETYNYKLTGFPTDDATPIATTAPTVTTGTITAIGPNGAIIPVTVTNAGSGPTADVSGIIHYPFVAVDRVIGGTNVTLVDGGTFTAVGTAESIAVGGLMSATRYTYRGVGGNTAGTYNNAGYSTRGDFWTLSSPPAGHSTLTGSALSTSSIKLDFQALSDVSVNAQGYILLREEGGTITLAEINAILSDATTPPSNGTVVGDVTVIQNITAGTTYTDNSSITAGNNYNYTLIPYTWNNSDTETYNYLINGAFPTTTVTPNSVTVTQPTLLTVCGDTDVYSTLGAITIAENGVGDFVSTGGSDVTLILSMPTGFKLNPGVGFVTATGSSTELTSTPPNIFVNEDNLIIVYSVASGAATGDGLIISGLQVKGDAGASGDITFDASSSASISGVTTSTVFAQLSATAAVDLQTLQSNYPGCGRAAFTLSTNAAVTGGNAEWIIVTGTGGLSSPDFDNTPTVVYTPDASEASATFRLRSLTANCTSVNKEITVNFNDFPTNPPAITGLNTVCSGTNSVQYQITGGDANYTYEWSITANNPPVVGGFTAQSSLSTTGSTTSSIIIDWGEDTSSDEDYTISVKAISSQGCESQTNPTRVVTVNEIPDVVANPLGASSYPITSSNPVALTGTSDGVNTLGSWSGPGVSFNGTSYEFIPSVAGNPNSPANTNHILTYTVNNGTCPISKTITVVVTDASPTGIVGLGTSQYTIYDAPVSLTLTVPAAPDDDDFLFDDPGVCNVRKLFASNLPGAAFSSTLSGLGCTTTTYATASIQPRNLGIITENLILNYEVRFGTNPESIKIYTRPTAPTVSQSSIVLCEGAINTTNTISVGNNGATSTPNIKYRWYSTDPNSTLSHTTPNSGTVVTGLNGVERASFQFTYAELGLAGTETDTDSPIERWVTQIIEDDGSFGGVESLPTKVTFTINAQPKAAQLSRTSGAVTYCNNDQQEVLRVESTFPVGTTFDWQWSTDNFTTTIPSTQITSAATVSTYVGQPILTTGATATTTTYYVKQFVNGCEGEVFQFDVTVNPITSLTTITTPPNEICEGDDPAAFTVNSPESSTIWEISETSSTTGFATSLTGVTFGANPTSAVIDPGVLTATKSYWVRQIVNGCPSNPEEVRFEVNENPPQPSNITAATSLVYCNGDTDLSLTAQGVNDPDYTWEWKIGAGGTFQATPTGYAVAINTSGAISTATLTRDTGGPALTTTATEYFVRQVNNEGTTNCTDAANELQITIVVNPTPSAPTFDPVGNGFNMSECEFNTPETPFVEQASGTPSTINWEWARGDGSGTLPAVPNWRDTGSGTIAGTNTPIIGGQLGDDLVIITNTIVAGTSASSRITHSQNLTTDTEYWVREVINDCPGPATLVAFTVFPKPATPTITVINTPDDICQGGTPAALSISGQTGATWEMNSAADFSGTAYTITTAATAAGTTPVELVTGGVNPQIVHNNPLTTTTTYFLRQTVDGCASDALQVTFTVIPTPVAPTTNTTITKNQYCESATDLILAADGGTSNTFQWSTDDFNLSIISASVSTITITPSAGSSQFQDSAPLGTTGLQNRYVRQVATNPDDAAGCPGPSLQIDFTVNPEPAAPTIPTIPSTCASIVPSNVSVTGDATATFEWSSVPPTDAGYPQPLPAGVSVDNSTAGQTVLIHTIQLASNTSYWVRQRVNDCPGSDAEVAFVVIPIPSDPTLTSGQNLEFCAGEDAGAITVNGSTGTTIEWSDQSDFSNILASNQSGTTSTFSPGTLENNSTTKYYVRQVVGASCPSNALEVDLVINEIPSQPSIVNEPSQYCSGETLENIAAAGSDGASWEWSDREDFSSIIGTEATLSNPITLTNTTETTRVLTYYVRQVNNDCTSEVQIVDINIAPVPVAPTTTNPDPFCTGTPITALTVEGEGIRWYRSSVLGEANLIGSGNSFTPSSDVVDNSAAGTSSIFVTQSINGCESTASEIRVTYNALPNAPVVTSQVVYCSGETIAPISAIGSGMTWYSDEELTTIVGTGDSFQPEVSNEVNVTTTTSFYVTQTSNNCQSGAAKVDIVVNPRPTVSISGLAEAYCADGIPAELIGSPTQTDGTRGTFSGPGVLLVDGVNVFNPSIAGVGTHTITYEFENANGCSDIATREVTVKPFPVVDFTGFNSVLEYCIDDAEVELVGSPIGGAFSGKGIVGGTSTFRPVDAEVGSHQITYTYTDEGGCTNTKTLTVNVVSSPIVTFSGLNSAYCINEAAATLTAQLSGNDTQLGTFSGPGIEGNIFSPVVAGEGIHTVRYEYTNESGCSAFIERDVEVNLLPELSLEIEGNTSSMIIPDFCTEQQSVILTPNLQGGVFSSVGEVLAFQGTNLLTSSAPVGEHEIIYTYVDPVTECQNEVRRKIIINPKPTAQFERTFISCDDITTSFRDISTIEGEGEVITRIWEYGDGISDTTTVETATHTYATRGRYQVKLTVITDKGCISEFTKENFIGDLPESAFTFGNVCFGQNVAFALNFDLIEPNSLDSIFWNFGDDTKQEFADTTRTTSHTYQEIGMYEVQLRLTTEQFCETTISREVSIFPSFLGENAIFPYVEDFENGTGGWIKQGDNLTWELGEPAGNNIKARSTSPIAWMTGLKDSYKNDEQSFVEGPCLDLRSLSRPMISMDIAVDSELGRDGAVLQYTADDGKTWQNVGDARIDVPINWYNTDNVIGTPGGQNFGLGSYAWSGEANNENNTLDSGWISARRYLDDIKDNDIIRLRVAFGADAVVANGDGFAFDNIWIGERSKTALLESFTNSSQTADAFAMPAINQVIQQNSKDAIAINYHIESSSGTDPFNLVNDLDPSGRALYYSVSQAPNFVVDGFKFETSTISFNSSTQLSQLTSLIIDSLQSRALSDVAFTVDVEIPSAVLGSNTVNLQVTSNITTTDEVVVHLAVVEREITTVTSSNGQTRFEWVLRSLNPSGGTSFQGVSWTPGVLQEREIEWGLPIPEDESQVALIAFVQNNRTQEIYQSVYKKPDGIPSIVLGNEDLLPEELQTIDLYPNPSTDKVYLLFGDDLNEDHEWILYNNNGKRLQMGTVTRGSNGFEVDVSKYPTGLYHIQLGKAGGYVIYKKIIVEQN